MKCVSVAPVPPLLTPFLFVPLIGLTACGGGSGASASFQPTYTLSVSPQPASIPVNGTVTFTATTNGPSNEVTWGIVGDEGPYGPNLGSGSPTSPSATFTYTAPPTPPIYEGPYGPIGSATLRVLEGGTGVQFNFVITAPSITTGFVTTSSNTSVALGKTLGILAYAVGTTNNAITMQVNGSTGGSMTYGTITPLPNAVYNGEYTYTAPATMPMSGNTVAVTVISQADPTKSSSMTITLTP